MKLFRLLYVLLSIFAGGNSIYGQQPNKNLEKANEYYEHYAFSEAIKYFQKVLDQDLSHQEAAYKLAHCYQKTHEYEKAARGYERAVGIGTPPDIAYFNYGETLLQLGRFVEAKGWFSLYSTKVPQDPRGNNFAFSCENYDQYFSDSGSFEVTNLPFNSSKSEVAPSYFPGGIVFQLLKEGDGNNLWTLPPSMEMKFSLVEDSGRKHIAPQPYQGDPGSKYSVISAVYDGQNKLVYFTNINADGNQEKNKERKAAILEILFADHGAKGTTNVRSLPFNNEAYSVGHPTLSPDGKSLYFVSDMPGGFGGTDIYQTSRKGDSWSPPINLGPTINTPGNELFPFYHLDGRLYFSSDGQGGMGGLDVWSSDYNEESGWKKPENPGFPINSMRDDFSFIIDNYNRQGYLASNRSEGKGGEDLYRFTVLKPVLSGEIVSSADQKMIDYAKVSIFEKGSGKERVFFASADGFFGTQLESGKKFKITVEKPGYLPKELHISTLGTGNRIVFRYKIELAPYPLELEMKVLSRQSGEGIRNAYISVLNDGRELNTDQDGYFRLHINPDSTYVFEIKKNGFETGLAPFVPNRRTGLEITQVFLDQAVGQMLVEGKVFNAQSDSVLDEVSIRLFNRKSGEEAFSNTGSSGFFSIPLKKGQIYTLLAEKTGYVTSKLIISTDDPNNEQRMITNIPLEPVAVGTSFVLRNIYYDLSSAELQEEAYAELDRLASFLRENPTLRIELSSHTDSRGSDELNLELSQRRAERVLEYLTLKGIAPSRILAVGYGEQRLLNGCGNDQECTEEKHKENRRTEFKVLGYSDQVSSEPVKVDENTGNPKVENLPDEVGKNMEPEREISVDTASVRAKEINPVITSVQKVWSVQIGLFSKAVAPEYLSKLGNFKSQLIQDKKGELFRYRVGKESNYETAQKLLADIRAKGYKDAFLVSMDAPASTIVDPGSEKNQTPRPKESEKPETETPSVEKSNNPDPEKAETKTTQPEVESPEKEVIENQKTDSVPAQKGNPVTEAVETGSPSKEGMPDLLYKIQIGLFFNDPPGTFFNNLGDYRPRLLVETEGNSRKYLIGTYFTFEEANKVAADLRFRGYMGAFVVALYQNERVPVDRGIQLETNNKKRKK